MANYKHKWKTDNGWNQKRCLKCGKTKRQLRITVYKGNFYIPHKRLKPCTISDRDFDIKNIIE